MRFGFPFVLAALMGGQTLRADDRAGKIETLADAMHDEIQSLVNEAHDYMQ